jgi:two-component system, sensor histidine kinase LadS
MFFKLFPGFILLVCSFQVCGQRIITIQDSVHEHMFTEADLAYLEDPNNNFTLQQVAGELQDRFVINKLFSPHNANVKSAYWIKLRIQDNPNTKKKWILEFFDQTTDYIEAYIPNENGYEKIVMGDAYPFTNRIFQHKNFEIPLANNTNTVHDYYFKIKSSNHLNIIVVVRSIDHFIYYSLNEYLLFGFLYGMILVVTIYNLLMYFAVRETQYLAYIAYIMSVGIYLSCTDGIAFQYLWPNHPEWNNEAYGIALFSVILWAMIFTKMFLHTATRHPLLDKIINTIIIARTLIFLAALFFYPILFEYRWIEFLPLSVAFFAGIYSYWKGFKAARFFALAYGLLFAGFVVKIMINMDPPLISGSIVTHYSITVGFWVEMWMLSFALGDKVRIIKDGKDRALRRIILQHEENQKLKDKVNRELEAQVVNRTKEINQQKLIIEDQYTALQTANQKLQEQADEIIKMNSLLDLDNYKLKNSIKEEMLARAGSKNMEFEEFHKIFPDELTCLRYLEQQKWENGFVCKKCENDKYLPGKGKFDRRCTRCGYSESPTAFTVFHGIKFPIEKAFYILHLVITERDDLTVDDISHMLDLRRNTCWGFKDKIHKIIKLRKLDKGQFVHWENVIFTPITKTDLISPSED